MTPSEVESLLRAMAGRRVLCVGDLVLDRFVYGASDRVSREAPVVALEERRRDVMLGAVGNVARNVAALGGLALMATVVGDDPESHDIAGLLAAADGIEVELIAASGRATPVKTRYVSGGQQMLCVDRNPSGVISADAEADLIAAVKSAMAHVDVVILSDYGRGAVTPTVAKAVIEAANATGRKVFADPRGRDFSRYDGAYAVKPNALELSLEAGMPVRTDEEAEAALREVMGRTASLQHLIVTRGGAGMTILPRDGRPSVHRSEPRDVYDVSGAGDTTIAALALATAGGAALAQAAQLANRAAGVAVSKVGTAAVRADEVAADAWRGSVHVAPVDGLDVAVERVAKWRADGHRIGFTNGCYDLLHVGHLATFEHARSQCDRLVVGVNADASVRRLKGPARPINTDADRARMVAALGPVDAVVVFEEDTAESVIAALKPDVYVKGGDYQVDQLPETPLVRSYGGEIVLAPLQPGRSTTGMLKKMAAD